MAKITGNLVATGLKFGIVTARFNDFINDKLLSGAVDALVRHGASEDDIDTVWVPGAFEIPLVAKKMAESGKYDAVICLGTVIRGSTMIMFVMKQQKALAQWHYKLVCQ